MLELVVFEPHLSNQTGLACIIMFLEIMGLPLEKHIYKNTEFAPVSTPCRTGQHGDGNTHMSGLRI
jgi:hypothetical protein